MPECEIGGNTQDVLNVPVTNEVRAARRTYDLCRSCRERLDQNDPATILQLGAIIGAELTPKMPHA
jgi:hypothetical protein